MSTTLEAKLYAAAAADTTLQGYLGSPFRWYDSQLMQGSAYPAVVALRVSTSRFETHSGINPIDAIRMQLIIWDPQAETCRAIAAYIIGTFLSNFDACSTSPVPPQSPNHVINQRHSMYTDTQPGLHCELLDLKFYNREDI